MRKETHADYLARLARAKEDLRQKLLLLVRPNICHRVYLEALFNCPAGHDLERVPRPANVGIRVAAALIDDVEWLRAEPPPHGFHVSDFPNAYYRRLSANAQAAARRLEARVAAAQQAKASKAPEALAELLDLEA